MIDKIKSNKKIIFIILAIVSCACIIPSIFAILGNDINDSSITTLVYYLCLIIANLLIIFFVFTKNELDLKLQLIPLVIAFGGIIVINVFNMIKYDSYSTIYYIAIYAAAIIVYLLYISKLEKLKYALYVLLAIILVFQIASALSGSLFGIGILILVSIFAINLFLQNQEKGEKTE